jgi:hypothetical protein
MTFQNNTAPSFVSKCVRNHLIQHNTFWEELIAYFPFIWHGPHKKRRLRQFFVTAGTCLPSRCLATIRGTYIQTQRVIGGIYEVRRWDGLRCHDRQIKFHKIGSGIQKLIGEIHRQKGDLISLLLFFQNKESRLIKVKLSPCLIN